MVMEIGTKIKKIRELRNFTQDYMAQKLNISQSTYSRFERNDCDLTISQLQDISEIFEIKIEDLLSFNEKLVFNNYHQANQGYNIFNNGLSSQEKELYEKQIQRLEADVDYLRNLLKQTISK